MSKEFNIVSIIENNENKLVDLSNKSKLVERINESFSTEEQQMFVASFYCYLNYARSDFVIDFETVWKWTGFSKKGNAKALLENNFIEGTDYIIEKTASVISEAVLKEKNGGEKTATAITAAVLEEKKNGGQNKEKILLTTTTFKSFCLKAGTKKAGMMHNYYIKLEEILQDILFEEGVELREKIQKLSEENKTLEVKNDMSRHETLVYSHKGRSVVYLSRILDNINGKIVIKAGSTDDTPTRARQLIINLR